MLFNYLDVKYCVVSTGMVVIVTLGLLRVLINHTYSSMDISWFQLLTRPPVFLLCSDGRNLAIHGVFRQDDPSIFNRVPRVADNDASLC